MFRASNTLHDASKKKHHKSFILGYTLHFGVGFCQNKAVSMGHITPVAIFPPQIKHCRRTNTESLTRHKNLQTGRRIKQTKFI